MPDWSNSFNQTVWHAVEFARLHSWAGNSEQNAELISGPCAWTSLLCVIPLYPEHDSHRWNVDGFNKGEPANVTFRHDADGEEDVPRRR
jgi:hypothetical protein